ncbi:hypothetical protein [Flavitalea sp.]|nr:hypothetical protein [Flavitalea sp.]
MKILKTVLSAFSILILCTNLKAYESPPQKDIYQIKVYRMKTSEQLIQVDSFLKNAYLPALHRLGISQVGVFKNLGIDTAGEKAIYVLIPLHSLEQLSKIEDGLGKDKDYIKAGATYLNVPYNSPAYTRIETIVLRAFNNMPHFQSPSLKGEVAERVYELRS